MKKIYTIVVAISAIAQITNAQTTNYIPKFTSLSTANSLMYDSGTGIGIGITAPLAPLHVSGNLITAGGSANIDGINLNFLANSSQMLIGWNKSAGNGEIDFVSNQGLGSIGGFSFYNHNNSNVESQLLYIRGDGNVGIGTTSPFTTLTIPSSTNAKYIGWDYANGSSGSRRWWFGNDQIEYGDFSFATESTQGRSSSDLTRLYIKANGNVLIGKTSQANTNYKLDVNGSARANEIVVNTTGADFVFEKSYRLPKLEEVAAYVNKNHHLIAIPTAREMKENGVALGELNTKLLQKVEELTLYLIEKDKQVGRLQTEVKQLKTAQSNRMAAVEKALTKLAAGK